MVATLTQMPAKLIAGDSFAWERDLSDYPADVWTLTYYFSKAEKSFNVVATASGTTHVVAVTGSESADYKQGRYRWHARVTDGTTVATIEDGWLDIKPNPTEGKIDHRSHARRMFDAIEAALEGQANKQQLDLINYSFGAVNVNRDRELLIKWRDKYARELQSEEGSNKPDQRNVFIRFISP